MKIKNYVLLFIIIGFINNSINAQISKPYIQKGITLTTKGFELYSAVLFRSNGDTLKPGTLVPLNEKITLMLHIKSGYNVVEGKVFPGGSEEIRCDRVVILKSDDLFAAYTTTGVSPKDGQYIGIKAKITEMKNKVKPVIVSFKVWDKKSSSEIKGLFRFKIL